MTTESPAPGWYPDPTFPARLRYWDGANWTPTPDASTLSQSLATPAQAKRGLRWSQKLMIVGAVVATVGIGLTAIATAFGPSSTDRVYLKTADRVLPGKSDSDRIDIGKSICKAYETGASNVQTVATIVTSGNTTADDAARLIQAAVTAYCPDQQYKLD